MSTPTGKHKAHGLDQRDRHFYQITNAAYWFGVFGHGGGVFMFWWMGMPEMALFNLAFSTPAFAFAIFLNKRGRLSLAFAFAFAELLLHQVLTTYYLGWEIGAHFYIIYLAGLIFFNPRWNRNIQYSLLAFVSIVYVGIYFAFQEPVYGLPEDLVTVVNITVAVSVIIATSLLINYFAKTTYSSEQNLIREKALTQRLLDRVKGLFGQQISREIASEMIETEDDLEARNFEATVMFMDIRGFTVLADSRTPQEVAEFQNTVFGAWIETIQEHHGVVLQLLGDGIMAVFGAPKVDPGHARNAVQAGYKILDRIRELFESGHIPRIRIGIGLHSGTIVAGNIGNETRKAYSLTGKNVIIAARIEPLNKQFNSQFLVSESVIQACAGDQYEAEDLGEVELKGIEQPVRIIKLR